MPAPSNKPKPLDGTLQECGTIEGHICMRCRHDMKEHILDDIALEVSRMADDSNKPLEESHDELWRDVTSPLECRADHDRARVRWGSHGRSTIHRLLLEIARFEGEIISLEEAKRI